MAAKTVLVEAAHQVGGNTTTGGVKFPGLFHAWGLQVIAGVGWEIVTNVVALDGGALPDFSQPTGKSHWKHQVTVNIPLFVAFSEETLRKDGVTALSRGADADRETARWLAAGHGGRGRYAVGAL